MIHKAPLRIIQKTLEQHRWLPVLLFSGPRGCGKYRFALDVAKIWQCQVAKNDFCNHCSDCLQVNAYRHPDVLVVNAYPELHKIELIISYLLNGWMNLSVLPTLEKYLRDIFHQFSCGYFRFKSTVSESNQDPSFLLTKLDEFLAQIAKFSSQQMQDKDAAVKKCFASLISFLEKMNQGIILDPIPIATVKKILHLSYISPSQGEKRIIIFRGIERLREQGANTLLKVLEEIPSSTSFILITEQLSSILSTVKSRANVISFKRIPVSTKSEILQQFGIQKTESLVSLTRTDSIWNDLKQAISYDAELDRLITQFFESVIWSYRFSSEVFDLVEQVSKMDHSSPERGVQLFLDKLIQYLIHLKRELYASNHSDLVALESKLSDLTRFQIDNWIIAACNVIQHIRIFHVNRTLALSSYLISIASQNNPIMNYR